MFQLEFVLRQIETEDESLKAIIGSILNKISSALECSLNPDFDDFMCKLYPEVSDKKLINLFYLFDEERKFKDLKNKTYDTLEDIGFLFAKDKNIFNNKYLRIERDYFFEINSISHLKSYGYNDLLFEIFKSEIKPEIEFKNLKIDGKRKINLQYISTKSLTEYFKNNGIKNELNYGTIDKSSNNIFTFIYKKRPLQNLKSVFKEFLKFVKTENNIEPKLISNDNKQNFYYHFAENAKKRLFDISIKEWMLIPPFLIFYIPLLLTVCYQGILCRM